MEHTHIAKDGTVYTHTHEEAHEHGHSLHQREVGCSNERK